MPPKLIDPIQQVRRYVDKQSGLVTQRQQTKALDRLKRSIPIPDPGDPSTIIWVPEGRSVANYVEANPQAHLKLHHFAEYPILDPITLEGSKYDGTVIEGGPGTVLYSPDNPSSDMLVVASAANIQLRNLTIAVGGGTATSTSTGVHIQGACDGTLLENLIADGFGEPIKVDGSAHGTATSAVWTIEVGSQATSGTFLLGGVSPLSLGQTIYTGTIAYNASAATMETALETIYGAGNVDVTGGGSPGTPYVVTFQSALADLDIPLPVVVPTSLAPANTTPVLVTQTTRGGGPWVTDTVLRRVSADESPTNWGVGLWWCDGVTLDSCTMSRNWLDGLKLAKRAENVTLLGGHCDENGQGAYTNAALYAGDGIDIFGGGELFRLVGTTLDYNLGSGLQAKNTDSVGTDGGGVVSGYGADGWGINRVLEFDHVHARGNAVGGLFLTTVSGNNSYAIRDVSITGGDCSGNARSGVFLDGVRNAVVQGAKANRNGESGFFVHSRSSYVVIDACQAHANKLYNAFLDGDHIELRGGQYLGVDTEGLATNTDLSALTAITTTNILVGANASHILIDRPDDQYTTGGRSIEVNAYTGSKTHDWPSIAAGGTDTTTVTVTGATSGMQATATMDISLGGLVLTAVGTSANTVTVTASNPTGGAIDRPSGTITVQAGAQEPTTIHHRRLASGLVVGTSTIYGGINSTAVDANGLEWRKTSGGIGVAGTWARTSPLSGSKTHDWASIANGAQATTTVTVTGAALGDLAWASMSLDLTGLQITAYVSAANTVTVVLKNDTGGAVDLASGTLRAGALRVVP